MSSVSLDKPIVLVGSPLQGYAGSPRQRPFMVRAQTGTIALNLRLSIEHARVPEFIKLPPKKCGRASAIDTLLLNTQSLSFPVLVFDAFFKVGSGCYSCEVTLQ